MSKRSLEVLRQKKQHHTSLEEQGFKYRGKVECIEVWASDVQVKLVNKKTRVLVLSFLIDESEEHCSKAGH